MSTCKGCGKKLYWGITEDGKTIPLDAVAPVYYVKLGMNENKKNGTEKIEIFREPNAFVTHFATCPKANQFSKGGQNACKNTN